MAVRVGVVGGGVAGLASATHLIELWAASKAVDPGTPDLEILLVAPLAWREGEAGDGIAGKAMSRTFEGRVDHRDIDRQLFYGPAMPHKGVIPHGFHVLWEYPNLRRMLGERDPQPGEEPLDGGLLVPKGGAGVLAVFQGNLEDPQPGGPGIALMGLSNPDAPHTATRPATHALFRLVQSAPLRGISGRLRTEFANANGGVDPLFFADLLFAQEVDLEMRLALILSSIRARKVNPEAETVDVEGTPRTLDQVEYDTWARLELEQAGAFFQPALSRLESTKIMGAVRELRREVGARWWLFETVTESQKPLRRTMRTFSKLMGPRGRDFLADAGLVLSELERIGRETPDALMNLATAQYKVWRTLHMRFGPDATFTSPYSYDAAQAARSLAFVFTTPRSARCWVADGARVQRLWVRMWKRLRKLAADTPGVQLNVVEGRVSELRGHGDRLRVRHGAVHGHGFTSQSDLNYPHSHSIRPWPAPTQDLAGQELDWCIPATAPGNLVAMLAGGAMAPARAAVEPISKMGNVTLELIAWTDERIEYSAEARKGLAASCITGLEGGWCLLADYSQGLWKPQTVAEEDPFAKGQFSGSIIESCGAWDDIWAADDRDDAFGWPAEVKQALIDLVADPAQYVDKDTRAWPHDEPARPDGQGWFDRRAGGTWQPARMQDPESMNDWWVASRWLVWQYFNQLSMIQALGPRAVVQFRQLAQLLDPRGARREDILKPGPGVLDRVRYVVMINAKVRNRIFSPGVDSWAQRPISGAPLPGAPRVFPAGDWTRNGLDIVCMEAATISGMRAAKGVFQAATGADLPRAAPGVIPVLPAASWYGGLDPLAREHE